MMACLAREPSCHALAVTYAEHWRSLSRHSMLSFLSLRRRLVSFDAMVDAQSATFFALVSADIARESGTELTECDR